MKRPELVSATQEQLDELLALARKASFPQPQYDLLAGVLGTFIYVMQALQNAKMSLQRFRRMLFGARTESQANVFKESGCDAGQGDDPTGSQTAATPDDSPEPANPWEPRQRRGRLAARRWWPLRSRRGRSGLPPCASIQVRCTAM